MRYSFFAAIMSIGLAAPTLGYSETYNCVLDQRSSNVVPERVVIDFKPQSRTATVEDFFTRRTNGGPIPAKILVNNAKRVSFTWNVRGIRNSSSQMPSFFSFRATIQKSGNKFSYSVRPSGFLPENGKGICLISK